MIDRIIDIAESGAYLRENGGLLEIELRGEKEGRSSVPLGEVAAVILSHPQITCTRGVLSGLMKAGAVVVVCDEQFMPVGMMVPLVGYWAPAQRMAAQVRAGVPMRKRLWQRIVKAKIRAQGAVLKRMRGDDMGLGELARRVRSGDPENLEGQASRIYWPALFGPNFYRNPGLPDQNRFLNYGYAVLRAAVARAICAAGLHPGVGLHHHHREDAYCLADDLMEPFRPLIDRAVAEMMEEGVAADAPLSKEIKARLIQPVMGRYRLRGEERTLLDILGRLAGSLGEIFEGREKRLNLPDIG